MKPPYATYQSSSCWRQNHAASVRAKDAQEEPPSTLTHVWHWLPTLQLPHPCQNHLFLDHKNKPTQETNRTKTDVIKKASWKDAKFSCLKHLHLLPCHCLNTAAFTTTHCATETLLKHFFWKIKEQLNLNSSDLGCYLHSQLWKTFK